MIVVVVVVKTMIAVDNILTYTDLTMGNVTVWDSVLILVVSYGKPIMVIFIHISYY